MAKETTHEELFMDEVFELRTLIEEIGSDKLTKMTLDPAAREAATKLMRFLEGLIDVPEE